jgi:glycerol-3-phosphate dehydrogenase
LGDLAVYGTDAPEIGKLVEADPKLGEKLHPALPYIDAEVVWAVRHEMARTIEDVLARRTRALFLNAKAALEVVGHIADLMASESGWTAGERAKRMAEFQVIARNYVLSD